MHVPPFLPTGELRVPARRLPLAYGRGENISGGHGRLRLGAYPTKPRPPRPRTGRGPQAAIAQPISPSTSTAGRGAPPAGRVAPPMVGVFGGRWSSGRPSSPVVLAMEP